MVAQQVTAQADTMGEYFYGILRAWRERYQADVDQRRVPLLLDPGLPGRYLETGMTPAEFRAFHAEVRKSEELAASALGRGDEQESAEKWQSLFGLEFPAPRATRTVSVPAASRARDVGEQFLSDLEIPERVQYGVRINAQVTQAGFQPFTLRGAQWPLKKKRKLEFYLETCEVPEPYSLKWKVKNTGTEAGDAKDLRGQIIDDTGYRKRQENTKYMGAHYVECYVIKSGVCVAKDRIEVPIASV
jgi:Adenylyl/Guanylyl and SMODS C-terminal sensor domain